jgi:hypothetical protein
VGNFTSALLGKIHAALTPQTGSSVYRRSVSIAAREIGMSTPKAIISAMQGRHDGGANMSVPQIRRGLEIALMKQGKSRAEARASISWLAASGRREQVQEKAEWPIQALTALLATIKAAT